MNHTKNYGLPQWELNDLIRMEDFNAMNNSIEAGLDSSAAAAASAVNIANFAKSTATAAQQAADYTDQQIDEDAESSSTHDLTGYKTGQDSNKNIPNKIHKNKFFCVLIYKDQ